MQADLHETGKLDPNVSLLVSENVFKANKDALDKIVTITESKEAGTEQLDRALQAIGNPITFSFTDK